MTPPTKLYKYCPIGVYSLRAISEAEVHHTSPRLFNDPLDCNPTIQIDISDSQLVALVKTMMGPWTTDEQIAKWLQSLAPSWDPDEGDWPVEMQKDYLRTQIVGRIKGLLTQEFGQKGVLSLCGQWNEPLLWSHYADQHKGICIEYDTSKWPVRTLGPVNYSAPRSIRTIDLYRWKVDGHEPARQRVYDTYFFAKAREWEYEREWRDINDRAGVNVLHFDITAIHFGLRCDFVWQRSVAKLLNQNHDIELYEMTAKDDTFGLDRRLIAREELERRGIQIPPFKVFGNILDSNPPATPFDTPEPVAFEHLLGDPAATAPRKGMYGQGTNDQMGGLFGLAGQLSASEENKR